MAPGPLLLRECGHVSRTTPFAIAPAVIATTIAGIVTAIMATAFRERSSGDSVSDRVAAGRRAAGAGAAPMPPNRHRRGPDVRFAFAKTDVSYATESAPCLRKPLARIQLN
jgi:hypothetical protein